MLAPRSSIKLRKRLFEGDPMNLFIIVFFIIDFLLLISIDARLFLKKSQTIALSAMFFICWYFFVSTSGYGLTALLFFSLAKFIIMHSNYDTWIIPLVVFIKNLMFLILMVSIFRDLPQFFFPAETYLHVKTQIIISLIMILTFYLFHYLNFRVVKTFHLKESLYLVSKKYKVPSIFIVCLFIFVVLIHEYLYYINDELALLMGLFLIIFCGCGLILFFLFMAKMIYLERLIQQLGEASQVSEQSIRQVQAFKHDYKNILIVLKYYLEKRSFEEADAYLAELTSYSSHFLNDSSYEQITRINNFPLRSLITDLYNKIQESPTTINFSVNCYSQSIGLPMETIDFVRCISIILTNAYEECLEQESSNLRINITRVDSLTTIEVKNSVVDPKPLSTILQKTYSSKADHSGLGLNNLTRILNDYHHVDCFFEVTQDVFSVRFVYEEDL